MNRAVITSAVAMLALVGCSQQNETARESPAATDTTVAQLPADLFAAEEATEAQPLHTVRATAQTGDVVTFVGYIGGRAQPFTDGRAVFVVADLEKAPPCDDGCPAAWDACCTAPDAILANSATVQVVDEGGRVVRVGLQGKGSLDKGSTVAVTGTVREVSETLLLVDASRIAVR